MPRQTYNHRRRRNPWGRNARLEMVVTAIVLVAVVAAGVVFVFVYHDLPFRLSGP